MDSIELISALSRKLQMLRLVLSYWDMSSAGKVSEEKLDQGRSHTRRAGYPRPAAQDRRRVPVLVLLLHS